MQEKNLADVVFKTDELAKIISVDKDKTKKEKRLAATLGDSEPEIVGDYIKKYKGDLNGKLLRKISGKIFEEYETINEIV